MFTARHLVLSSFAVALALLAALGCSEDNAVTKNSAGGSEGLRMLGLSSDRVLVYNRLDTVYDQDLNFDVVDEKDTVRITGVDDDWVVKANNASVINLIVTDGWVTQNGCWKQTGGAEQVVYWSTPPVLMPPSLQVGERWDGIYPAVDSSVLEGTPHFLYSYFGFYFTRHYVGTQLLHVTGGSFTAHRFDVELFRNSSDASPTATATEYYVPNVGLIKLRFSGGALKRTLSIISYD